LLKREICILVCVLSGTSWGEPEYAMLAARTPAVIVGLFPGSPEYSYAPAYEITFFLGLVNLTICVFADSKYNFILLEQYKAFSCSKLSTKKNKCFS